MRKGNALKFSYCSVFFSRSHLAKVLERKAVLASSGVNKPPVAAEKPTVFEGASSNFLAYPASNNWCRF